MEESRGLKKVRISDDPRDSSSYNKKPFIIILIIAILISLIIVIYKRITLNDDPHHYDYIIVGSGLFGATFNYLARKKGKRTLVLERRNVTGGNLYCDNIEGIFVHKYGPHVFHTDNKTIWDFLNNLVEFTPYQTQSIAKVKNKMYNLPYSMWTFHQMWGVIRPDQAFTRIEEQKYRGEVYDLKDQAISLIGKDVYDMFINENIQKEWGRECPNLPPFIIPSVPTRYVFDNNYFFQDRYQGIPVGCYNELFKILLNDTEINLNTDYIPNKDRYDKAADKIIFTGKVDELYNYSYGSLEYRTVRWENEIKNTSNFQGSAVIHYPDKNINYTRVVEHKHFDPYNITIREKPKTVVSYEYYEEWNEQKECVYPLNDEKNNNVYLKYKELMENENKIIFGGRLATYKYYDMKDIIEEVLKLAEKEKLL
jgi:UDP-galactopyranose mutase